MAGLAFKLAKRSVGPSGAWWMVRGTLGSLVFRGSWAELAARTAWTVGICAALTVTGTWAQFALYWIVPFCTWHMLAQYVRLICEHSGMPENAGAYALTRTTLARPWERFLLVPRNIHYHVEHHFYPSVPFYNLPALHDALMAQAGYRENAVITGSVADSLREVVTPRLAR